MRLGSTGKGVEVNHPPRGMRCARGSAPGLRPEPRSAGHGAPAVLPRFATLVTLRATRAVPIAAQATGPSPQEPTRRQLDNQVRRSTVNNHDHRRAIA
jgi:hypothetical protein